MNKLEELEGKIYVFTINSFGFLHTLKLKGLLNKKTDEFTILLQQLNKIYSDLMETADQQIKIKLLDASLSVMEQIHHVLMDLHYDDFDLVNEKADLQIDAAFIKNDLNAFLKNMNVDTK